MTTDGLRRYEDEARWFVDWLRESSLPLLARQGRDPAGGFFECLRPDGEPLTNQPKRLRVQARQAFSFARAGALGLMPEQGAKEASDHGWSFLLEAGLRPGNDGREESFIHVFGPSGEILDGKRDTYDHAFVLLAAAERHRLYRDPLAPRVADKAEAFLSAVRSPAGGFAEGEPASLPRRQNPHMHLLEAALLWREAGSRPFQEDIISEVMNLYKERFRDHDAGVLREFFEEDWSPHAGKGETVEPGHMVEWVWLLDQEGSARTEELLALVEGARRTGSDQPGGLLCNSAHHSGTQRDGGCRLWHQTEHIRACLVLARRTGEDRWLCEAGTLLAFFRARYLTGIAAGAWHDEVTADGKVLSDRTPASLLYHLITLADEILARQRVPA